MFARVQLETGSETTGQPVRKLLSQAVPPLFTSLLGLEGLRPTSESGKTPGSVVAQQLSVPAATDQTSPPKRLEVFPKGEESSDSGQILTNGSDSAPVTTHPHTTGTAHEKYRLNSGVLFQSIPAATTKEVAAGVRHIVPAGRSREAKHAVDLGSAPATSDFVGPHGGESGRLTPPVTPPEQATTHLANQPALEHRPVSLTEIQSASQTPSHYAGSEPVEAESGSTISSQFPGGSASEPTSQTSAGEAKSTAVGRVNRFTPLHEGLAGIDVSQENSPLNLLETNAVTRSNQPASQNHSNVPPLSTDLPAGAKTVPAVLSARVGERIQLLDLESPSASVSSPNLFEDAAEVNSLNLAPFDRSVREKSSSHAVQSQSPSSLQTGSISDRSEVDGSEKSARPRGGNDIGTRPSASQSANSLESAELASGPTSNLRNPSSAPVTGVAKAKAALPQASPNESTTAASSISEAPLSLAATRLTDLSATRHATVEGKTSTTDGFEHESTSGFTDLRTILSTPNVLEVGVNAGSHGWLRVRAELGASGEVAASLQPSSALQQHALGEELSAISHFLDASTGGATSVSITPHDGPLTGILSGASHETTSFADSAASGQRGQAPSQPPLASRAQDAGSSPADPTTSWAISDQAAAPASSGWLSVRV